MRWMIHVTAALLVSGLAAPSTGLAQPVPDLPPEGFVPIPVQAPVEEPPGAVVEPAPPPAARHESAKPGAAKPEPAKPAAARPDASAPGRSRWALPSRKPAGAPAPKPEAASTPVIVPSAPVGAPAPAAEGGGDRPIKFNFKDASIESLLKYVSEQLGLTIIKEAREKIEGTVTAVNAEGIPPDQVLTFIDSVLKPKGLTTLRFGDIVKVVDVDEAKRRNIQIHVGSDPDKIPLNDTIITQIIPLKYAVASEVFKELANVIAKTGELAVNARSNTLVLTDTSSNVHRFVRIIKELDRQLTEAARIKVYVLKYSDAEAVAHVLNEVFGKNESSRSRNSAFNPWQMFFGGGRSGGMGMMGQGGGSAPQPTPTMAIQIATEKRTNSVILVTSDDYHAIAKEIIDRLDIPMSDLLQVKVYLLKHADALDTVRIIKEVLRVETAGGGASPQGGPGGGSPRDRFTRMFGIATPAATDRAGFLPNQSIDISADPRTNAVFVIASKEYQEIVQEIVAKLDIQIADLLQVRGYPLRYADAQETERILRGVLRLDAARPAQAAGPARTGGAPQDRLTRLFGPAQQQPAAGAARGLLPNQTIEISSDVRTNTVFVVASKEYHEIVKDIIAKLDLPMADLLLVRAYPLQYADAQETVRIIKEVLRLESARAAQPAAGARPAGVPADRTRTFGLSQGGRPEMPPNQTIDLTADSRTNTVFVAASKEYHEIVKDIIAKLDVQMADLLLVRAYPLQHAEAQETVRIIKEVLRLESARAAPPAAGARPAGAAPDRTRTFGLSQGGRPEMPPNQTMDITADTRTNTVFVAASKEYHEIVKDIIAKLDVQMSDLLQVRAYPLRHADAQETIRIIKEVLRLDPAGAQAAGRTGAGAARARTAPVVGSAAAAPSSPGMLPNQTIDVSADTRTNTVFVVASKEYQEIVQEIIAKLDVPMADLLIVRAYPLQYADVQETVRIIKEVLRIDTGAAGRTGTSRARATPAAGTTLATPNLPAMPPNQTIDVSADLRTNTVFVVASKEYQEIAKEIVAKLDVKLADLLQVKVYMLQHADAQDTVRIVKDILAAETAPKTASAPQTGAAAVGRTTRLFGAAESSRPGMLPNQTIDITADPRTNSIVVVATKEYQVLVKEIIEGLDSQIAGLLKVRVYRLVNADAVETADIMTRTFLQGTLQRATSGRGAAGTGALPSDTFNVTADARTNTLIIRATEDNLRELDLLVRSLDEDATEPVSTVVVPLKNGSAQNIAGVLQQLLRSTGGTSTTTSSTPSRSGAGAGTSSGARGSTGSPSSGASRTGGAGSTTGSTTGSSTGSYPRMAPDESQPMAPPTDSAVPRPDEEKTGARSGQSSKVTGDVDVRADPESNAILIRTPPRNLAAIRRILEDLDRVRSQVLIKVLIAEVTLDDTLRFGVQGYWENGWKIHGETQTQRFGTNFGADFSVAQASGSGFLYRLSGDEADVRLQALNTEGRLKVLSTPRILALHNEAASINVGQDIPEITNTRYTDTGSQINTIQRRDIGIILQVTPRINPDGLVTMTVHPEVSTLAPKSESVEIQPGVFSPVINRNFADTTVAVPHGQTVVIGGLIREIENTTVNKIPLLGDIPLLGALFRNEERIKKQAELMIFLTPYVVNTAEDLQEMTRLERSTLKLIGPADIQRTVLKWEFEPRE
jgi:type II secretion system protein D